MLTRMYVELGILRNTAKEKFYGTMKQLLGEEKGAVAAEYALLIAGISVALTAAIAALYAAISGKLLNTANQISGATAP